MATGEATISRPNPALTPYLASLVGRLIGTWPLQQPFHSSTGPQRIDVPGSRLAAMHQHLLCSEDLPARLKVLLTKASPVDIQPCISTNLPTSLFNPFCIEFFSTMDLDKGNAIPPQAQPPIRALPDDGQPCRECRRRKAKCDRTTPVCNVCQRYKRHCLYDKHSRTSLTRKSGTFLAPL